MALADTEGQLEGLRLPLTVALPLKEPEVEGQEVPETDTLALCETVSEAVEQRVGD